MVNVISAATVEMWAHYDSDNPTSWDSWKDRILWRFENKQKHWITKFNLAKIQANNLNGATTGYTRVALLGKIGTVFHIIGEYRLPPAKEWFTFYHNGRKHQEGFWDHQLTAFDEIQLVISTVHYAGWGATCHAYEIGLEFSIDG